MRPIGPSAGQAGAFACGVALLLAMCGAAGAAASAASQAQPERLQLGVVRADGVMLPFASYDGDDWKRGWPDEVGYRELPATIDDVPPSWWGGVPPGEWRLWARDTETPSAIKPVGIIMLMVGRFRRLGIRTDQKPVPMPAGPFQVPFPKLGLAVSGDVPLRPIAQVSRLGPAWRELLPGIRDALTAAEDRTVSGLRSNASWRHPFDRKARQLVEPELEAWYTSTLADSDSAVSYFEVVKKYPPQPRDEGCGLETLITGWLHHAKRGETPKASFKAVVTYCDREKASYMLPFGQLTVGGRTHWVFQMSGRDHEWYSVTELSSNRVRYVVEYYGGGLLR